MQGGASKHRPFKFIYIYFFFFLFLSLSKIKVDLELLPYRFSLGGLKIPAVDEFVLVALQSPIPSFLLRFLLFPHELCF